MAPPRRQTPPRRRGRPGDGVRRPRDPGRRMRPHRIRLLAGVAVLVLGLLTARAAFLGTVRAGELADRASEQNRYAVDLDAQRGSILSRDGRDLAIDRLAVNVTATPYLVTDPEGTAAKLGAALERDPNELAKALAGRGGYEMLAREVSPRRAERAKALDLPGIDFEDTYQRFQPGGPLAAQVVGLTGDERQGLSGIEAQLDDVLTGRDGRRVEVRDVFGRPLKVLADADPEPGTDVRLTIDTTVQERVVRILAETRKEFGAKSAMALVMRPRDGAILAMATVPGINPNDRRRLNEDNERNRPVTDTFEPGSTFKIVTMAGALEEGVVTPTTSFDLPVQIRRYDRELKDSEREKPVTYTATEILEKSSNIGTVFIAERLGKERVQAWIERFGFGRPTGIDFPGEVPGIMLPADAWSGTSIINIPIGQGIGVTLTQLTRAFAAVANGGLLVRPHLVERVGGEPVPQPAPERIMSRATARKLDRMLRTVVSDGGTGTLAQVQGYEIAGKTGTANKIDEGTGEYSDSRYLASFVGYAPASRPELLIAVAVDEPTQGAYYGGVAAAPAFEQIAEFSLQTLGIAP